MGAGVRMWEQRVGGGPSQPGGGGGLGAALFDKQEVAAMNSSGSASGQIKTLYSSIRKKLIMLYLLFLKNQFYCSLFFTLVIFSNLIPISLSLI